MSAQAPNYIRGRERLPISLIIGFVNIAQKVKALVRADTYSTSLTLINIPSLSFLISFIVFTILTVPITIKVQPINIFIISTPFHNRRCKYRAKREGIVSPLINLFTIESYSSYHIIYFCLINF